MEDLLRDVFLEAYAKTFIPAHDKATREYCPACQNGGTYHLCRVYKAFEKKNVRLDVFYFQPAIAVPIGTVIEVFLVGQTEDPQHGHRRSGHVRGEKWQHREESVQRVVRPVLRETDRDRLR